MSSAIIVVPLSEYKQTGFADIHLRICFAQQVITGISYIEGDESIEPLAKQLELLTETNDYQFATKMVSEVGSYFRHSYFRHSYFRQKNFQFTLKCNLSQGTAFQQRVWLALSQIPFGSVKTYGELAKELNSSARAIGNACRRNHFPFIIPCHRIVSASGVGGYAGDTLTQQKGTINFMKIKQSLLAHENAIKNRLDEKNAG